MARRQPPSMAEIERQSEQKAQEWAKWLQKYIDLGMKWVIEERSGAVPTKRYKRTIYSVYASRDSVVIKLFGCDVDGRIPQHLIDMGHKVKAQRNRNDFTISVFLHS